MIDRQGAGDMKNKCADCAFSGGHQGAHPDGAAVHVYQPVPGPGAAPTVEGSDCTWHQDPCTMTCMIVTNMMAGTEQRS